MLEHGVRTLVVPHSWESPFHRHKRSKAWPWQKSNRCIPYHLTQSSKGARTLNLGDSVFLYTGPLWSWILQYNTTMNRRLTMVTIAMCLHSAKTEFTAHWRGVIPKMRHRIISVMCSNTTQERQRHGYEIFSRELATETWADGRH